MGLILLSNIGNLGEKIEVTQHVSKKLYKFKSDIKDISVFAEKFCTHELRINNLKFNHMDKKELFNVILSNKKYEYLTL